MVFNTDIIIELIHLPGSEFSFPFYIEVTALAISAGHYFYGRLFFIGVNDLHILFEAHIIYFFIGINLYALLHREQVQKIINCIAAYSKTAEVKPELIPVSL